MSFSVGQGTSVDASSRHPGEFVTGRTKPISSRLIGAARITVVTVIAALAFCNRAAAESMSKPADQVPVTVTAAFMQEWDDAEGHISILRGQCRIVQGSTLLQSRQMVIWRITQTAALGKRDRLTVYLEDDVRIEEPGSTYNESPTLVTLSTRAGVSVNVSNPVTVQPARDDAFFLRAQEHRRRSTARIIRTTQLTEVPEPGPELRSVQLQRPPSRIRRIRIRPRSGNEFNMTSRPSPNRTPPEQVTILTGGVTVLIEGLDQRVGGKPVGTIELSADRMVIWSRGELAGGAGGEEGVVQSDDEPFDVYMEGNVVIFQGDPTNPQLMRKVHAASATFDAREKKGLLMNAEIEAYLPSLKGSVRIWAERIRQLGPNEFHAQSSWITPSPYGKPGYRIQATDAFLEQRFRSSTFGGESPPVDPATGNPDEETQNWITSMNNVFFIEDVPVFYLPYLSGPADKSQFPLQSVLFAEDKIFGVQIRTQWDLAKLLGFTEPRGSQWTLLADYLSDRGPAVGVTGKYHGTNLFGIEGKYNGELNSYFIYDHGTDDLGSDRLALIPPSEERGWFDWKHLQTMPNGFTVEAELGYISDRNFLDQYFPWEFDRGKDVETVAYVKQQQQDWAWTALVQPELQNFEYTTEWLPRGDFYTLGHPLLDGWLTWSSHTSAGYAIIHQADPPTDPNDLFTPISYYPGVQGADLMTRHEVDAPFNLGPVKVVPFAMGEAAYWGEGFDGQPINRLAISAGVRSTLEMSKAFPEVQSDIFGLNGMAHKVLLEASYRYTSVSNSMSNIPQYNEFDDNAQERFRERLVENTYGGILPLAVDPRLYALRTGAGFDVTSPYNELIDDQEVVRLAIRQRLQTKFGPPDHQRIRDWMTLDLEASFFPDPGRDNFGAPWGLITARYAWNLSQRTSLLANAIYDYYPQAPQMWNVGVLSQRSERGSVYVGLQAIKADDGVLDSDILTASYSYQMSSKWIATMGTAYDLGEHRNAGQSFTFTRVGLDWLFHVAGSYDVSTGDVSFAVAIEPRIGNLQNSMTQLSNLLGRGH
jgi:hypothetical protein